MNICGIYKITNPKGKIYIGQSKNIANRWIDYKKLSCKSQRKLYNSLKKYGFNSHILEIIEECEFDLLNTKERYWQDHYNVIDRQKGLNCVLTATDNLKCEYSEESRASVVASLKEYHNNKYVPIYQYNLDGKLIRVWNNYTEIFKITGYTKSYIADCCNLRYDKAYEYIWRVEETTFTEEFLLRVRLTKSDKLKGNTFNLGRKMSEETKNKLSLKSKGFKHSSETKNTISKANSKQISQYSKQGEFIRDWSSASEAGTFLNIASQNISHCCNKRINSAYGFIWKFKN